MKHPHDIDLTETAPGEWGRSPRTDLAPINSAVYGPKSHDPHAEQWRSFWAAIKFLIVWTAIVGAIDILVTY